MSKATKQTKTASKTSAKAEKFPAASKIVVRSDSAKVGEMLNAKTGKPLTMLEKAKVAGFATTEKKGKTATATKATAKKSDNATGTASTRFSKSPGLTHAERVAELKARIERYVKADKSHKAEKHPNYATYQNLLKMTPAEVKERDARIRERAKSLA